MVRPPAKRKKIRVRLPEAMAIRPVIGIAIVLGIAFLAIAVVAIRQLLLHNKDTTAAAGGGKMNQKRCLGVPAQGWCTIADNMCFPDYSGLKNTSIDSACMAKLDTVCQKYGGYARDETTNNFVMVLDTDKREQGLSEALPILSSCLPPDPVLVDTVYMYNQKPDETKRAIHLRSGTLDLGTAIKFPDRNTVFYVPNTNHLSTYKNIDVIKRCNAAQPATPPEPTTPPEERCLSVPAQGWCTVATNLCAPTFAVLYKSAFSTECVAKFDTAVTQNGGNAAWASSGFPNHTVPVQNLSQAVPALLAVMKDCTTEDAILHVYSVPGLPAEIKPGNRLSMTQNYKNTDFNSWVYAQKSYVDTTLKDIDLKDRCSKAVVRP